MNAPNPSQQLPLPVAVLRRWCAAGILLAALAGIVACLPYAGPNPWLDLPSHFSVQALIGLGVIAACGRYARLSAIHWLALAAAAFLHLWQVAPFLPRGETEAPGAAPLKLLQANTLFVNKDAAAFERLVQSEKPDIVVMAEANTAFEKMFKGLRKEYPYQDFKPDDFGSGGIGVASRLPLKNLRTVTWPGAEMPAYVFAFDWQGKEAHVISLHTPNPVNDGAGRDATLQGMAQEALGLSGPVIVAGDFNATPWCPALRHMTAALPRFRNLRAGRGLFLSWPTFLPPPLRIPIDETLVSDDIAVQDYHLGPMFGSDHLPVISTLALKDGK